MPELGEYESMPRPESIGKLIDYLRGRPVISGVELDGEQLLNITRNRKPDICVFMTNIYIVSIADVADIQAVHQVDAIVTMSAWNGYTSEAKQYARENGVGLFLFRELLGAVYYSGNKFLDYTPPERD